MAASLATGIKARNLWIKDGVLPRNYCLFGVTFASDFPLALPAAEAGAAVRLCLRYAGGRNAVERDIPVSFGVVDHVTGDDWMISCAFTSGALEMEWKDWLTLVFNPDGTEVQYRVEESTYPTAFEAYIANFAISAALLLQGEETLHSTVIAFEGLGIGLLGGRGAGTRTELAPSISSSGICDGNAFRLLLLAN